MRALVAHDELPQDGAALATDVIPGPSGAALTLLALTPRLPVHSAWDLGCGSGVQSAFLAQHADRVVATDIDPRALEVTAATAQANAQIFELRLGSLFEPVAGERFDLIVANPPFVIGDTAGLTHRSSPLAADGLAAALMTGIPEHLNSGGSAVLLCSWLVTPDTDAQERISQLLPEGCDAWVGIREVLPVDAYIEVWLQDAGRERDADLRDNWRVQLDAWGAQAVAFGAIWLAPTAGLPVVRVEDLRGATRLPTGDELLTRMNCARRAERLDAVTALRSGFTPADLQGWRGEVTLSPVASALRRLAQADQPLAALVHQLAEDLSADEDDLLILALVAAKELVDLGLLT